MGRTVKIDRGELVISEVRWKEGDDDALMRKVMALLLRPPRLMDVESVAEVESAESSVVHGDFDTLPER